MSKGNATLMASAAAVREWLIGPAIEMNELAGALGGLCDRIVDAGIPLARATTAVRLLHASTQGVGREWRIGEPMIERVYPYSPQSDQGFNDSPYGLAHRTGEWVMFDPRELADSTFTIVADLKKGGYTQYVCIPLKLGNSRNRNAITFATRAAGGFAPEHLEFFRTIEPAVRIVMELRATERNLVEVLQTYVGGDPHRRILAGDVHRGTVTRIRSAILFSDLRGYTGLSMQLPEEDIADLLNRYFDCVVPEIERCGGEVLKFIGDGILAIFQQRGDCDAAAVCNAALAAAVAGLDRIARANTYKSLPALLEAGIALHYGEAAYGNVGSRNRLDFTVIGRDVNIASRMSRLNAPLAQPILMSQAFVDQIGQRARPLGAHPFRGVAGTHTLFAPSPPKEPA